MVNYLFPLLLLLCLCSCGIIPDYQSPVADIKIPKTWQNSQQFSDTEIKPWLEEFNDPQLNQLIDEALAYNYDLKASAARVLDARAKARIQGASRFPTLSTNIRAARSQRNSTSGFKISNPRSNTFGIDFVLSWELDVWGRLKNQSEAALQNFSATDMDYQAARLSLAGNVALSWFKSIEADQQLQLAEKKVTTFKMVGDIIREGFIDGINSALDLRLAQANIATAKSQRDVRELEKNKAIRSLEILLGRYPAAQLQISDQLPALKPQITIGLPNTLLRSRPDIVAAEQRLIAADQRFTAAWKNLLPRLSFSTSAGTNAGQLADILDYNTLIWNILGNLTQPIFQGGLLMAEKDRADAHTIEAAADYAQTILQAYYEVETALTAEHLLNSQQQALQHATEESIEAKKLALEEYNSGLVDITTLLEAQRRAYEAQSTLLQVTGQRLVNRITLHLALGGNLYSKPIKELSTVSE